MWCPDAYMFRILIDTSVESFINDHCQDCGLPFKFTSNNDGSSSIVVDLAGLIEFSAGVVSAHSVQHRPSIDQAIFPQMNVVDFRGLFKTV